MKHDTLQGRLEEAADIQAKFLALESQYKALADVVKDNDNSAVAKVRHLGQISHG